MTVRVAGLLLLASALLACKDKAPATRALSDLRVMPGPSSAATADPTLGATPHDPVEYDGALTTYTVTQTLEASAAPKPDPDLAIVQAARASAASCFSGLTGGSDLRSASIRVTVIPSGTVSRTEVSSDPDVADCLRSVGDSLHFSSKDEKGAAAGSDNIGGGIRSFSIDVSVSRSH